LKQQSTKNTDKKAIIAYDEFEYLQSNTKEPDQSSYSVALLPENMPKNRYGNILPPNSSRVVLSTGNSTYINANYIPGFDGNEKTYIATQGPLKQTVEDFWRMIWENNCCVVIMLAKIIEAGKEKVFQYWPDEKEVPIIFGDFSITLRDIEIKKENTTRRIEIKLNTTNETKIISQLHYTNWPDHGVPKNSKTFLELIKLTNELNLNKSPIIVHCSAGVGRTGTFIVVHYWLSKINSIKQKTLKRKNEEIKVNIIETISKIREYRPKSIQSVDQYLFCHRAITEHFNPSKEESIQENSKHYQKFENIRQQIDEPEEFN